MSRTRFWLAAFAAFFISGAFAAEYGLVEAVYAGPEKDVACFPFRSDMSVLQNENDLVLLSDERSLTDYPYDFSCLPDNDPAPHIVFTRYRYLPTDDRVKPPIRNVFSGLVPGALYRVSFYSLEAFFTGGTRRFYPIVNGVTNDLVSPWTDAGGKRFAPVRYSFDAVPANTNGVITFELLYFDNAAISPVCCAITVEGSARPAAPVATAVSLPDNDGLALTWSHVPDTLCYYVEKKNTDGTWKEWCRIQDALAWTNRTQFANVTACRVVASNGVGRTESSEIDLTGFNILRPRYALAFGNVTSPIGRFAPGQAFVSNFVFSSKISSALDAGNLSSAEAAIYTNFTYAETCENNQTPCIWIIPDDFKPGASYQFRLHTVEPWYDVADARTFFVQANGVTVITNADTFVQAGGKNKPAHWDFSASADEKGRIAVCVRSLNDRALICALEARESALLPIEAPPMKVIGFKEYVCLTTDLRNNEHHYDIERKDGETGVPDVFASAVQSDTICDASISPEGITRYYRARVTTDDNSAPWSDWIAADRTHSVGERFRMNSQGFTGGAVNEWVSEVPYRFPPQATFVGGNTSGTVDFSGVTDPAPQAVYLSGAYVANTRIRGYRYAGLSPLINYRLRLHLCENWFSSSGSRTFQAAVNHLRITDWPGVPSDGYIDVYKLAGAMYKAVILEHAVRPCADGTLDFDIFTGKDNAIIRGLELIPDPDTTRPAGILSSFRRKASDSDTDAPAEEPLGAPVVKNDLTWSQADVPAGAVGTATRVLSSGRVLIPYTSDDFCITTTGNGTVNVWIDAELKCRLADGKTTVSGTPFRLTAGFHDFYVEQLSPAGTLPAASIQIQAAGKDVPLQFIQPAFAPDPAPWRFHRLHGHWQAPSFAVPQSADGTAFSLCGSGDDTWGSTDDGSFLYRDLTGSFEMKMRISSISGNYVDNSRFGFEIRGGLGKTAADGFVFVGGFNPRNYGANARPAAYWDADLSDGLNIGDKNAYKVGANNTFSLPLWVRLRRVNSGVGKSDCSLEVSKDGENWTWGATQTVARLSHVLAGPFVLSHQQAGTNLAQMNFDNLEITDLTRHAMLLIVR